MVGPSTSWNTVNVHGTYRSLDGTPVGGTIRFSVPHRIVATTDKIVFPSNGVITASLSTLTGSFSVDLPATDDPDISPTSWSYRVEEQLSGASGATFNMALPLSYAGTGLDISTALPSEVFPPELAPQYKGVAGGVAALNSSGQVVDASGSPVTGGSINPTTGRNVLTSRWHPSAYSAAGDYSTDDTSALQACIDACSAAGGGTVQLGQHVVSGSGIHPKPNVRLVGVPGFSKLKQTTANPIVSSSVACSNVEFEGIVFEGTVSSTPTDSLHPTRTRTTSGTGATTGIWIDGDLDTTVSGAPVITNVHITRCHFRNMTSLPIRIFGVRGSVRVVDNWFYNNQDPGFGFNQEVVFNSNHSLYSADNGVSISRGNLKVTCVGNTIEACAYHGIWVSGFTGSAGPVDFTVSGNTIKNPGQVGIIAQDGPVNGTIAGNTINKGLLRGDVSAPTDDMGFGILVRGNSSTPGTPGSMIAKNIKVAENTIVGAPKAGIGYDGATGLVINDNYIADCGSQYLADGTTTITASYTSTNVGIQCSYPATVAGVRVRNNDVIDSRATPYCNWALQPVKPPSGVAYSGNTMLGCRNQPNTSATLDEYAAGYYGSSTASAQETMPRWAAPNQAITMSSGTLRLAYLTARKTRTVTQIRVPSGGTPAAATPTLVRFGLYSVDASTGNLTLMSANTSDTSIFAGAGNTYTQTLAAAQQIVAGQRYAIGVLVVTAATAPTICGVISTAASEVAQDPQLAALLGSQTDLPASITAGALSTTASIIYAVVI